MHKPLCLLIDGESVTFGEKAITLHADLWFEQILPKSVRKLVRQGNGMNERLSKSNGRDSHL
jgi:hypothetical protein